MKIGYQGIDGSNSKIAARLFKEKLDLDNVEYVPLTNSINVCNAIKNKEIDLGVMATYNTTAGIVEETEIALKEINYKILEKMNIDIHHCAYKRKDVDIKDIKFVASHIQALLQSKNNIKKLFSNCEIVEIEDTAIGARYLSEGKIDKNSVIVCTKEAGKIFNLDLIYENIEDLEFNQTEFIIIKLKDN